MTGSSRAFCSTPRHKKSCRRDTSGDEQTLIRSPGFITRGFLCFYAAFASVGVGAGGVVEAGSVASIGTTFPFPIRLAELHAAKVFASSAAALFT